MTLAPLGGCTIIKGRKLNGRHIGIIWKVQTFSAPWSQKSHNHWGGIHLTAPEVATYDPRNGGMTTTNLFCLLRGVIPDDLPRLRMQRDLPGDVHHGPRVHHCLAVRPNSLWCLVCAHVSDGCGDGHELCTFDGDCHPPKKYSKHPWTTTAPWRGV